MVSSANIDNLLIIFFINKICGVIDEVVNCICVIPEDPSILFVVGKGLICNACN